MSATVAPDGLETLHFVSTIPLFRNTIALPDLSRVWPQPAGRQTTP